MSEIRELRQLREENSRLKRLVADLTLDKHILSEVIRKKCRRTSETDPFRTKQLTHLC